jgi:hypothetical protein
MRKQFLLNRAIMQKVGVCALMWCSSVVLFSTSVQAEEKLTPEQMKSIRGASLPPMGLYTPCDVKGTPCKEERAEGGGGKCFSKTPVPFNVCNSNKAIWDKPEAPPPCVTKDVTSCVVATWLPLYAGKCDRQDGTHPDSIKNPDKPTYPTSPGCTG